MVAMPKGDGAGRFHAADYWKLAGSGWDYGLYRGDGSSTGYFSGAGAWYYIIPYTSEGALHPFACKHTLYPHYAVIS